MEDMSGSCSNKNEMGKTFDHCEWYWRMKSTYETADGVNDPIIVDCGQSPSVILEPQEALQRWDLCFVMVILGGLVHCDKLVRPDSPLGWR